MSTTPRAAASRPMRRGPQMAATIIGALALALSVAGCRGDRSAPPPPPGAEPAAAPTDPPPTPAPADPPPAPPPSAAPAGDPEPTPGEPAAAEPPAVDPAAPTEPDPSDPAAAPDAPASTGALPPSDPAAAAAADPGEPAVAPGQPSGPELVQAAVALADTAQQAPEEVDPPPGQPADALDEGTAEQLLALKAANEALARNDQAVALAGFIEAFDGPTTGASISAGLAAAELHDAAGRVAEATAIYERLIGMAPDVAEIHFTAGRHFAAAGKSKRARAELERSIELEADFLPAYPLLGGVYAKTGKKKRAAELMLTYETRLKGLLDTLADPQVGAHRKVPIIDVFALVDDDRVTRGLIGAVADPSMHVRLAAADALTHDADPAALEAIARAALSERDAIARRALAASLKRAKARMEASTAEPKPQMPRPRR